MSKGLRHKLLERAADVVEDRRAHFAYCDCMRDARCRRRQDQDDGDTSEALMKR